MERRRYEQAKTFATLPLLMVFLIVVLERIIVIYVVFNGKMPAKFDPSTIKNAFQWAYEPMTVLLTLAATIVAFWPFFIGALAAWLLKPRRRLHLVFQTGSIVALPCLCWYVNPGLEDISGVIFLAVPSSLLAALFFTFWRPSKWMRELMKAVQDQVGQEKRSTSLAFSSAGIGTLLELIILYLAFCRSLTLFLRSLPGWVGMGLIAIGFIGAFDVAAIIALLKKAADEAHSEVEPGSS